MSTIHIDGKVFEAINLYASLGGYPSLDGRDLFPEMGAWGFADGGYGTQYLARKDNRLSGEVLPVFLNWFQLKIVRDRCRQIARNNEFAIAALNCHKSYVVGTGFKYQVLGKREGVPRSLILEAQELIDLSCEHNRISEIESEMVYRLHVDGEFFIRQFPGDDGLLRIRFIEPELVKARADDNNPNTSFGIECAEDDLHNRVAYWVIQRPWLNQEPEPIPADEVIHVRLNVESNAKRGLPTIYAVESNLRAAEEVLQAMISVAKARAKIAMIRKLPEVPLEGAQALQAQATTYNVNDPLTGQNAKLERYGYGSIITANQGTEYEFPSMNIGAADLVETLNANLRAIAGRFGVTETMISADASNNNYASALVAEAPAVKTFGRLQKLLSVVLAERRTSPERSILWNQVNHAVKIGLLPQRALTDLTIKAVGPSLVARDSHLEAQTHKAYLDMGAWSLETVTAESGKDFEEEQTNRNKHPELYKQPQAPNDPNAPKDPQGDGETKPGGTSAKEPKTGQQDEAAKAFYNAVNVTRKKHAEKASSLRRILAQVSANPSEKYLIEKAIKQTDEELADFESRVKALAMFLGA